MSRPTRVCETIIKLSALVHPDQIDLWLHLLHNFRNASSPTSNDNSVSLVSGNVVLLQQCLRKLWVVATRSDPSRYKAQNTEFYVTLDEILSPDIPCNTPRPGASYYSSIYSKSRSLSEFPSENVLIPIVGSGTLRRISLS